jgi:hypothetical protein
MCFTVELSKEAGTDAVGHLISKADSVAAEPLIQETATYLMDAGVQRYVPISCALTTG